MWWWCSHPCSTDLCCHYSSTAVFLLLLFDKIPTVRERKKNGKQELTIYKRNVSCRKSTPIPSLAPKNCLAEILQGCNRAYVKAATNLHECKVVYLWKVTRISWFILDYEMMGQGLRCIAKPAKVDHSYLHFDGWWHFYSSRTRQEYLVSVFTLTDSSFVDVFDAVATSCWYFANIIGTSLALLKFNIFFFRNGKGVRWAALLMTSLLAFQLQLVAATIQKQ